MARLRLKIWSVVDKNVKDMKIVRLTTDSGDRLVGLRVPDGDVMKKIIATVIRYLR